MLNLVVLGMILSGQKKKKKEIVMLPSKSNDWLLSPSVTQTIPYRKHKYCGYFSFQQLYKQCGCCFQWWYGRSWWWKGSYYQIKSRKVEYILAAKFQPNLVVKGRGSFQQKKRLKNWKGCSDIKAMVKLGGEQQFQVRIAFNDG